MKKPEGQYSQVQTIRLRILFLNIFFQTNIYLPGLEIENSQGYIDIYLQRGSNLYPK
jgi:hypothetical protein